MIIGVDAGALSIKDDRLRVGVWRVTYNLLKELSHIDKTNEYRLYTFRPISREVMRAFGSRMINVVVRPMIGWSKIQLPIELRRHPVDAFLGLSQMLPYYSPAHAIGFVYDLGFLHYPSAYPGSLKKLEYQTKQLIRRSGKIIAISEFTKKDIVKTYATNSSRIAVAYPGADERFNLRGPRHTNKNPYILFVGAIKRGKNVPLALRIFKNFLASVKEPYDFIIVGGNYWEDPEINDTIAELGLRDRVQFTGFIPDKAVPSYYRGASALLVSSRWEGFCLPAVEAMACGCPIVSVHHGSLPEIVGEGGAIFTDEHEAALVLKKVTTNALFRKKLIRAGLKRSKQFTWKRFARSIYGIISSR